jgi:hypothetical protein
MQLSTHSNDKKDLQSAGLLNVQESCLTISLERLEKLEEFSC